MTFLIALGLYALALLFVIALCRAAAHGDQMYEDYHEQRHIPPKGW